MITLLLNSTIPFRTSGHGRFIFFFLVTHNQGKEERSCTSVNFVSIDDVYYVFDVFQKGTYRFRVTPRVFCLNFVEMNGSFTERFTINLLIHLNLTNHTR